MCFQTWLTLEPEFVTWTAVLRHVVLSQVIYDIEFYILHRWLHTEWAYKKFHKVHHEYKAPFSLTAEHGHPFENLFCLALPFVFSHVILSLYHPLTIPSLWLSMLSLDFRSITGHSGYSFPILEYNPYLYWMDGGARYMQPIFLK